MYFSDVDPLSAYALGYAGLKVLSNIYPHHQDDDFEKEMNKLIGTEGWKRISSTANFLKHADRDPHEIMEFHPDEAASVIGLATLLFRRITGEFSAKMQAFDVWVEAMGAEELGIPELDQNAERAARDKEIRAALKAAPRQVRIAYAKKCYDYFLANRDWILVSVEQAQQQGKTLEQILDERFGASSGTG